MSMDLRVLEGWKLEQMWETCANHPALIACQNSFMVLNHDQQTPGVKTEKNYKNKEKYMFLMFS